MPDWIGWGLMIMFIVGIFINAIFNPIIGDPKECAMMVTDQHGHLKVYMKEGA